MKSIKKSLSFLKKQWLKFAKAVGWFNTRLILSVVYFVFVGVYALITKLFKFFSRAKKETFWIKVDAVTDKESYKNQF